MTYGIGITTARRATDYLTPLLRTMGPAVLDRTILAPTMPGDIPAEFANLRALDPLLDEELGVEDRNSLRCLEENTDRLLRALASKHAFFLTLQDDTVPCRNVWQRIAQCVEYMRRHPQVAWISFYTPHKAPMYHKGALWPYPAGQFYGELALLWRREAALEFLSSGQDPAVAHDLQIQSYFRDTDWLTFGHVPCLFQHTGIESATGKTWDSGQRVTEHFHPLWDAMRSRPLPP